MNQSYTNIQHVLELEIRGEQNFLLSDCKDILWPGKCLVLVIAPGFFTPASPAIGMPKVATTFKMSELKNKDPLLLSHRFKWAFKRKETIMSTLKYAIAVEEHCGEHIFLVLSAV